MSDRRSLSIETLGWLLRLNARGSPRDRNVIEAVIREHLDWRPPYGPRLYLTDVRAEQRELRAKGGRQRKRRVWAEALAERVAEKLAEGPATAVTAQDAWDATPSELESILVEAGGRIWEAYRDGDRLVGRDDRTGVEQSISRSTFLGRYYRKRR